METGMGARRRRRRSSDWHSLDCCQSIIRYPNPNPIVDACGAADRLTRAASVLLVMTSSCVHESRPIVSSALDVPHCIFCFPRYFRHFCGDFSRFCTLARHVSVHSNHSIVPVAAAHCGCIVTDRRMQIAMSETDRIFQRSPDREKRFSRFFSEVLAQLG